MHSLLTQEHWIITDHGRLFAKRWTPAGADLNDAPLVLFHDSLGCVELWRDFPERLALATNRGVIAYDRLGFGKSDPHPSELDKTLVHDGANLSFPFLREQLEIEGYIAFGHSIGGGIATACAAINPAGCGALILESAQAFVEDRTIQSILDAQRSFGKSDKMYRLQKYHGEKAHWVLSAWIDTWLAPDFSDWTLDDYLSLVCCPALVIHGDSDEYGSILHPYRIAGQVPGGAIVEILSGCGHVPHREQGDVVIAMVNRLLANASC